MQRNILRVNIALVVILVSTYQAAAQNTNPYPKMAPLDQYLISDRNAEIGLARSAAPPSIARDAKVLVLGSHGYDTAVQGKNGFVCMVVRSWVGPDDNQFWNPKVRAPICFNAAASRYNVPLMTKKTELALAGRSKTQIFGDINTAFDKKQIPPLESGAMCYMLSKQGYLNDDGGHWHPHVMIFTPLTEPAAWGGDSPDSPVIGVKDSSGHASIFMVLVDKWSDGTADTNHQH